MAYGRIVFDLDGTLVDASDRLYDLFVRLVPAAGLSKAAYWELKRKKVNHVKILSTICGFDRSAIEAFEHDWLGLIESSWCLEKDRLYSGVPDSLISLRKAGYKLYIATARQFPEVARSEIERFGLDRLVDEVVVTGPDRDKLRALSKMAEFTSMDAFVGDTGKDVLLGKHFGARTFAVSYGFLSRESLLDYSPTGICDSPQEVVECFGLTTTNHKSY